MKNRWYIEAVKIKQDSFINKDTKEKNLEDLKNDSKEEKEINKNSKEKGENEK